MNTFALATDTQLINVFQNGDTNALEVLVYRYKDKIYTSILFLVKDKYLAEDLFQEVFIKIIDTLRSNRYNEEGKFLPWALRISHNLCVDYFRKVKRTHFVASDERDVFESIGLKESSLRFNRNGRLVHVSHYSSRITGGDRRYQAQNRSIRVDQRVRAPHLFF